MDVKFFNTLSFCLIVVCLMAFVSCSTDSKTLKITPKSLDFENVYIGDDSSIDIVLKNKYGKPIIISNLALTGSSDFIITSGAQLPINLIKNAEHVITIQFKPTSDGPIQGLLTIVHDGSTKNKEVELEGVGVACARIVLSENSHDFAKKLINKIHDHSISVENIGTADLVISALNFSGTGASVYSTSNTPPVTITPGTTSTITISFNPLVIGNYSADLSISHNAVNENSVLVYGLLGEGIDVDPQITLSTGTNWDFGSVAKTMPSTQVCEIENTGIDPLTVTSATLTTNVEFAIDTLKDSNGNVINFPQIIAVGAKIMLHVQFSPTANTTYNDTLTFVHDGTNEVSPWDVSLSGEGRDEINKTFTYTGAQEQWTVPAGVSSIVVECFGAAAGNSINGTGAQGGSAKAKVPVTPGDTVYVFVGGEGTMLSNSATGGFNGGGGVDSATGTGTGGGASDIRIGGTDLTDRKVVGAGGGGGGWYTTGGKGGGLSGEAGQTTSWTGGGGGTQTTGGTANTGRGAFAGTFGLGGRGKGYGDGGGGGGGGWYGGGGGWANAGGGGSSYYDAAGNTDKSTQSGVRSGNGEITFTY